MLGLRICYYLIYFNKLLYANKITTSHSLISLAYYIIVFCVLARKYSCVLILTQYFYSVSVREEGYVDTYEHSSRLKLRRSRTRSRAPIDCLWVYRVCSTWYIFILLLLLFFERYLACPAILQVKSRKVYLCFVYYYAIALHICNM